MVALILALTTRHVILSLGVAVCCGSLIVKSGHPIDALLGLLRDGVFLQLAKPSNAQIIIVITLISGFVYLLEQSGGLKVFSVLATRYVAGPLQAQILTWATGLGIFFTDSGNALILGPMFSPIYDRLKVSREKLAYIIDSTASPTCVLVPIISWGVYIQGLTETAFKNQGRTVDGFATFLEVIPYQFYPWLALLSVPIYAVLKKDWGPMAKAEAKARTTNVEEPTAEENVEKEPAPAELDWSLTLLPLGVLFLSIIFFFVYGYHNTGELSGSVIRTALGTSYLVAAVVAGLWYRSRAVLTLTESFQHHMQGMQRILPILLVLLLAWTFADLCKVLGTGPYLGQLLTDALPIAVLPSLIFLLGAVISVSTGSSWGTFAILIPIAVPISLEMGASPLVCLGAAISGGLLGDHCSPISDTTILSSMATGCVHARHVSTQFPYALLTAGATCIGFIIAEITRSPMSLVAAFLIQLALILLATSLYEKRRSDPTPNAGMNSA